MTMPTPDESLADLEATIGAVRTRYLAPHLAHADLAIPSPEERLDMGAFVVLAHAALEDFFERLALWVHGRIQATWSVRGKAPIPTLATILHLRGRRKVDSATSSTIFDRVHEELLEVAKDYSNLVEHNHGASSSYLRELLYPLGVDLPADAKLIGSLDSFCDLRGDAAHRAIGMVTTISSAKGVDALASDCLQFAKEVKASVTLLSW